MRSRARILLVPLWTLLLAPLPARAATLYALEPFTAAHVGTLVRPAWADIDADGDLDVFVGAADGNTYFLENQGSSTTTAFGQAVANPFGLADVGSDAAPTFADLDADGDLDAFVGVFSGDIRFFENTGSAAAPAFAAATTNPFGLNGSNVQTVIAFADIDGDGDLDAFTNSNGPLRFFENTGTPAAPAFAAEVIQPFGLDGAGDHVAFADIDDDGDLDYFAGSSVDIYFQENTGSSVAPAFAPRLDSPFGLSDGEAPAFGDIDDDGDLDILVGEESGAIHSFANVGTAAAPAFVFTPAAPVGLTSLAISSRPALADIDADGDFDAFVGNPLGTTYFFENVGTSLTPVFAAALANPFGLGSVLDVAPSFTDIDDDGDLDAFLGGDADLRFSENVGSAAVPSFAAPVVNPFGLTSIPTNTKPTLADIDADGDPDLLVGTNGILRYFENVGTPAAPAFAAPVEEPFGLSSLQFVNSPTFVDVDGDGDVDVFVGGFDLAFQENVGTPTAPAFAPAAVNPLGLDPTLGQAMVAFADIDDDGDRDAFVRTGIQFSFYRALTSECPPAPDLTCQTGFSSTRLVVDERVLGKEKLLLKLARGPQVDAADLGDPTEAGLGAFNFCLYDDLGSLAGEVDVNQAGFPCKTGSCWKSNPGQDTFRFTDTRVLRKGVRSVVLKAGAAGRSRISLAGRNDATQSHRDLATGIAPALSSATSVTVQVFAFETGACFSATLSDLRRQTSSVLIAR